MAIFWLVDAGYRLGGWERTKNASQPGFLSFLLFTNRCCLRLLWFTLFFLNIHRLDAVTLVSNSLYTWSFPAVLFEQLVSSFHTLTYIHPFFLHTIFKMYFKTLAILSLSALAIALPTPATRAITARQSGPVLKDTTYNPISNLLAPRNRSIKRLSNRNLARRLRIQRNIIIQLLRLIRKFCRHIVALRLLSLEFDDGGHELEHFILDFAVLVKGAQLVTFDVVRKLATFFAFVSFHFGMGQSGINVLGSESLDPQ